MSALERDLGAIEGPILCFGGPYGNLEATVALLAAADRLGFSKDRVICTGDVAAYCADPRATVYRLREAGIPVVMGNCEESLGFDREDCGCGFAEDSACERLARRWFLYARSALDAEAKAWMRGLPRRLRLTLGGRRLAVIHGGVADIARFVFESTPASEKQAEMDTLGRAGGIDGVIAGHSGLPFTHVFRQPTGNEAMWHNAGVIGMPANDGTPRVWYSVLAALKDGIRVSRYPLAYDHARAARRVRGEGLPEGYARALEDGLWPSQDILPAPERARQGTPIAPQTLLWRRARAAAA